jgi:hypothetical protein
LYNIFLQQEAVQTIPWPAMSPDMNPIEHVWDFIGRKIIQRNPKCQNIDETLSRYFWPVRLPSRTYKSNLQSKEKQPQTVTPPPPKAVVPKVWVQTIPWPAMSPDMNHIEQVCDFIGRKINQRNPKYQNIDELRTALYFYRYIFLHQYC